MAAALIFDGDELLVMKRANKGGLFAGFWSFVGGHLEKSELNDPRSACLRELYEEIGLVEKDFVFFDKKYITLRRKENEIRIQYLYVATTKNRNISETDEGELFWIKRSEIFNRTFSAVNESVLRHYFEIGKNNDDIYVGVLNVVDDKPLVNWETLSNYIGSI